MGKKSGKDVFAALVNNWSLAIKELKRGVGEEWMPQFGQVELRWTGTCERPYLADGALSTTG